MQAYAEKQHLGELANPVESHLAPPRSANSRMTTVASLGLRRRHRCAKGQAAEQAPVPNWVKSLLLLDRLNGCPLNKPDCVVVGVEDAALKNTKDSDLLGC